MFLFQKRPKIELNLETIIARVTLQSGNPDVDFRSRSKTFKVHKKVLEKNSSVLKAKLSDVWKTSGDVLQLDEEYVEPEVIEDLLNWLYFKYENRNWTPKIENAYSLCIAADYLMISELVTSCCDVLRENITPENFYDLYTLSKHLNLGHLRQACDRNLKSTLRENPNDFFLSPHIGKWKIEELKMFIEKLLEIANTRQSRETIFLSWAIWADASFEDRFREFENLLGYAPPEALSSDALFRFIKTDLYSKLDEARQKQYYVRSYLPIGISSTDKLYCVLQTGHYKHFVEKLRCLDLSTNQKWSSVPRKRSIFNQKQEVNITTPVLGLSWQNNMYFIGHVLFGRDKRRHIKVLSTQTGECVNFEVLEPLRGYEQRMLAGVVLGDYIYISESVKPTEDSQLVRSVCRFNLKTKLEQWKAETIAELQTARFIHKLVAHDGLLYAIGGEIIEPCQHPRPERYDPQTNRWEYIAPSHYHHKFPAAVAHEGQIYVLSKAGFEAYLPETDRWIQLPAPDVCCRGSLVSIVRKLWLMTDSTSCFNQNLRLVYELDVVKQEWTRLPDMPEEVYTDFAFVIKQ